MGNATQCKTKFVTFYSFKGGVGRSSALINSAIIRARQGNRVVVIDFDFEAPGLNSYCQKVFAECEKEREGIVEYFYNAVFTQHVPSLKDRATNLTNYINSKNGGELSLISAGNTKSKRYAEALDALKWSEIFEKYNGELVLQNFKQQLIQEFEEPDYVFIDSRTGITEIGGVCTRYLADMVVILSSLNHQNIQGTAAIFRDLKDNNKKFIFVASNIPVGMPAGDEQLLEIRTKAFAEAFGKSPDLFIYYYPSLSLEEALPSVVGKEESEVKKALRRSDPLFDSYRDLARKIDSSYKNSFLNQLEQVCQGSFILYASDPLGNSKHAEYISQFKRDFPDRLLSKIFFRMIDWISSTFEKSPLTWNHSEYKEIITALDGTAGTPLDHAELYFQYETMSKVRKYLSDSGVMVSELEVYFMNDEDQLEEVAFEEMGRQRYNWAASYFRKVYDEYQINSGEIEDKSHYAAVIFNLARCMDFIGDKAAAKKLYKEVLKYKDDVFAGVSRFEPAYINRLICMIIIFEMMGQPADRDIFYNQLKSTLTEPQYKNESYFSPISYRRHDLTSIMREVENYILASPATYL